MKWLVSCTKTVLLVLGVLLGWVVGAGLFVLVVETFWPGERLLQVSVAAVSFVVALLIVRRGYRRIWKTSGKSGARKGRTKRQPARKKRPPKRRRGLDELYGTSFDEGDVVAEVTLGYRILGDDLPRDRTWKGDGRVRIGDITLERPLAYVSPREREACPGTICLGAKVAPRDEVYDESLDYWPCYADLSPRGRRGYLRWLADGARTATVSVSYAFLYFYGLEQRALGDRLDLGEVREEVLRLHGMYGSGRSFHGYACALVGMTHALETSDPSMSLARLSNAGAAKLPLPFLEMLSTCWPDGNWPADYVLALLRHHCSHTIVQKRTWREFEELFRQRFDEAHPRGLTPRRNAKRHRAAYRWAANTGTAPAEYPYLELTALGRKWTALQELWALATKELKPYATAAGRATLSEGELYQRLPAALRTGDHPEQQAWQRWFDEEADEQELCLTSWGTLVELSPSIVPKNGKLTPKGCRSAAELCDSVGLAMEPDPRVGRGSSRPLDEALLVYRPAAGQAAPPDEYHDALSLMVELCVGVAEADGEVSDDEIEAIIDHLDRQDTLGDAERERLLACVAFFHRSGAGLKRATRARLGKLPAAVRAALAHLVVLVALADGVLTAGEEKALKKVYRALDLPPAELDEVLRPHREVPAEADEAAPVEPARVTIDWARVADIAADTRDVQAMLHEALAGVEESEPRSTPVEPTLAATSAEAPVAVGTPEPSTPVTGTLDAGDLDTGTLDPRAAELVAWIRSRSTDTIAVSEWDTECKSRGLMAAMAVDMINEWADEQLDDYLIEGDGPYTLNRDLL